MPSIHHSHVLRTYSSITPALEVSLEVVPGKTGFVEGATGDRRWRQGSPRGTLGLAAEAGGVKNGKPVHYLRKCYGSLAVADHRVFIASKLLGHASISLTASTYAGQVDKLPAVKF